MMLCSDPAPQRGTATKLVPINNVVRVLLPRTLPTLTERRGTLSATLRLSSCVLLRSFYMKNLVRRWASGPRATKGWDTTHEPPQLTKILP